jgi:hypothetical protein
LRELLARHAAIAGTVHFVRGDHLELAAAINIPPPVQAITQTIARGKGMAGIAWERDAPIQTCNLQEDASGAVRPGAKAVNARAAVALPLHRDGATFAVCGLAWLDERVLAAEHVERIRADAESSIPSV